MLDGLAKLLLDLEERGCVHGDLKASNIRVGADDRPVLLDVQALGTRPGFLRSRMLARDRSRLLRNWAHDPAIGIELTQRLGRGQRTCTDAGAGGWQG